MPPLRIFTGCSLLAAPSVPACECGLCLQFDQFQLRKKTQLVRLFGTDCGRNVDDDQLFPHRVNEHCDPLFTPTLSMVHSTTRYAVTRYQTSHTREKTVLLVRGGGGE